MISRPKCAIMVTRRNMVLLTITKLSIQIDQIGTDICSS
nr:MAG TPA: hypothetical protein [Caudoviricetes sp.]